MSFRTLFGHEAKKKGPVISSPCITSVFSMSAWLRGVDLNHRPLGYEPNRFTVTASDSRGFTAHSHRNSIKTTRVLCPCCALVVNQNLRGSRSLPLKLLFRAASGLLMECTS